jgi:hypothetical protein
LRYPRNEATAGQLSGGGGDLESVGRRAAASAMIAPNPPKVVINPTLRRRGHFRTVQA